MQALLNYFNGWDNDELTSNTEHARTRASLEECPIHTGEALQDDYCPDMPLTLSLDTAY